MWRDFWCDSERPCTLLRSNWASPILRDATVVISTAGLVCDHGRA